MTDWEELLAKRAELLGTPRIFGKEMQITLGAVPYVTRWELKFCEVEICIEHSSKSKQAWKALLMVSYSNIQVDTRQEAEAFVESELRKLRDALQDGIR